jgi:hypothetical protein
MPLLPPGWKPAPSPVVDSLYSLVVGDADPKTKVRRFTILYSGATRLVRTFDLEEALRMLEVDMQFVIARMARNRFFVRAGVVGWGREAIVIPGPDGIGKSTLVAALLKAGGVYYSDEFAVVDPRGRVHPYPIPLGRCATASGKATNRRVEPVGAEVGTKPLPIGLILFTQYKRGAQWKPKRLSPGQAAFELLMSTIPTRRQPELAMGTLYQIASSAVVLKGIRGEAKQLIEFLRRKELR